MKFYGSIGLKIWSKYCQQYTTIWIYTSNNPQKFTDFKSVVRFLIRQIDKKLFKKLKFLQILPTGGQYFPTNRNYIGEIFDVLSICTIQVQVKH